MVLFARGKLFKNLGSVLLNSLIGIIITAGIFLVLIMLAGLNIWIAAGIAGLIGGFIQPYLFKDLKYA